MLKNLPDVLSVKEIKEVLHCGRNKVLELIHDGSLEGHYIGGRWLVFRNDLEEFIEKS